jgi:glucose/arabinose dehydrogenase
MLYVALGERSVKEGRVQARDLGSHFGKIVRIRPDGGVPKDNPFADQKGARPEIWSLGHRNVLAAALDARKRLWVVEMGPRGGDELNLIERGVNYGWPSQSYGEEYSGFPIRGAATERDGMRQPVYYWDPVIAPSGAEWYTGDAFPAWRGSLFVGALKEARLVRLVLGETEEGWRVVGEEQLLVDRRQRIRDVRQGPDGALYVVTDEDAGELWRLAPPR